MTLSSIQDTIESLSYDDRFTLAHWIRARLPFWSAEVEAKKQAACPHVRAKTSEFVRPLEKGFIL